MQITTIHVGKTINTGNYQSVRIDLTADVTPNESLTVAKLKLDMEIDRLAQVNSADYKQAKRVLASPDEYTGKKVKWAEELVASIEGYAK
jgi:hypothetical protein